MNRRWICNDVWMDILPCFDRPQLGLKLALLSPRFNALVDKHFDGKNELTIWKPIIIDKGKGPEPTLSVEMDDDNFVPFPLPNCPLPSKIRFKHLQLEYIDHFVITFLRANHQIFDKRSTNLQLWIPSSNEQPIWDVLAREIWPIFSTNIHRLGLTVGDLDNLLRLISPTILTDLNQLISIDSCDLLPDAISDDFDGPNGTISAGQALSKWLHSPRKDGQPKRLRYGKSLNAHADFDWVNSFKEQFLRANAISSVSYEIRLYVHAPSMQMVPFELVNEWTKEKLTLAKAKENYLVYWIMKRCKIIGENSAVHLKDENWDNNCNNVFFWLFNSTNCIGPLSPPPKEEKDEAGQSITKVPYSADK